MIGYPCGCDRGGFEGHALPSLGCEEVLQEQQVRRVRVVGDVLSRGNLWHRRRALGRHSSVFSNALSAHFQAVCVFAWKRSPN